MKVSDDIIPAYFTLDSETNSVTSSINREQSSSRRPKRNSEKKLPDDFLDLENYAEGESFSDDENQSR